MNTLWPLIFTAWDSSVQFGGGPFAEKTQRMGNFCSGISSEPPVNPERVDLTHFELLKVVGKGGFGKVNACQRRTTDDLYALKRMSKSEVIKRESHIRMVMIERSVMAKLSSPFLCTLDHAFQSPSELFFIMPFMQGGDLRFHMSQRPCFSESEARFYIAETIMGLEAMHQQHVVYRDLKPDNILLDSTGHIRLSDFGLAVELQRNRQYKTLGNAGTTGYLAPGACVEQGDFSLTLSLFPSRGWLRRTIRR